MKLDVLARWSSGFSPSDVKGAGSRSRNEKASLAIKMSGARIIAQSRVESGVSMLGRPRQNDHGGTSPGEKRRRSAGLNRGERDWNAPIVACVSGPPNAPANLIGPKLSPALEEHSARHRTHPGLWGKPCPAPAARERPFREPEPPAKPCPG